MSNQNGISTIKQNKLIRNFCSLLSDLRHPDEVNFLVENFFTESERQTLAKRLEILVQLNDGKSYEEIIEDLNVSSATISSFSELKDKPLMQRMFKKMAFDQKVSGWLKKIFG